MQNRFLAKAFEGRGEGAWYILTVVLCFLNFLIIGSVPLLVVLGYVALTDSSRITEYLLDPTDFSALGLNFNIIFIGVMMQFVIGIVGMLFAVLIHKRGFRTFFTGFPRVRWGRFLAVAGIYLLLSFGYTGVMFLVNNDYYQVVFEPMRLLAFLPFALLLLPIQTAFEEVFFRGLLLQGLHRLAPRLIWMPWIVSSILFAFVHSLNPEVGEYGILPAMVNYVGMGLLLGFFAITDEGLEISWGIHLANNFFSFVFVGYEGMALPSPVALLAQAPNLYLEMMMTVLFCGVIFLIFCRKNVWSPALLFRAASVKTPESNV